MNILLLAPRLARQPWTLGDVAARLCDGLAARGCTVDIACECVDDRARLAGARSVVALNHFKTSAADFAPGFPGWCARMRETMPHDASLSLARRIAGDVWMPLDASAASWLGRVRRTRSIKGRCIAIVKNPGVFPALAVEAFRRLPGGVPEGRTGVKRVVAFGSTARGEAMRLLTPAGLDSRVVEVPYFSGLAPSAMPAAELDATRARARALLNIRPDARVLLASIPQTAGRSIAPMLAGLRLAAAQGGARGSVGDRIRDDAPVLVLAAKDCVATHTLAVRSGVEPIVRVIGLSTRIDALLAAADAGVLPMSAGGALFEAGAVGRFAADSLRMGRPLIALSGAPGYDLVRQTLDDASRPGLIVDRNEPEHWSRAIRALLDTPLLGQSSLAARRIGETLRFDALMGALVPALADAAQERRGTLPMPT